MSKIDSKIYKLIIELIDPDNTKFTRKDRYMKTMKAVCLFMSVDKDMSHTLSRYELGILFWLLTGEEPKEGSIDQAMKKLDVNGDGTIVLSEWIDYLATLDNKKRKILNYTLKQKFDLYDEDGSGTITIEELEKMFIDSFEDLLIKTEGKSRKLAESIVKDFSKIALQQMDLSQDSFLDWTEFKKYIHISACEESKISDFLEKL